jgi:hypothetical protein
MSTLIRTMPSSSVNSICVSGGGKPALINSSRTRLSCGDSAPPSTSFNTDRSRRIPRAPGLPSARATTSGTLKLVAFASASKIGMDRLGGDDRPMSNAVRSGVVIRIPLTVRISRAPRSYEWTMIPDGACRLRRDSSAGSLTSSHLAPRTAAADSPVRRVAAGPQPRPAGSGKRGQRRLLR